MLNPGRVVTEEKDQHFESQFERQVFQLIADRGFHVRTQVCVGDPTNHRYRIDLVVEGMQGRLAVECDGDQWHGPDRYEQDMARQRDLERAGWQFVRIRGSDFYRDYVKAMEPLWAELDRLGIKPGGIDEAAAEPPLPADSLRIDRKEVDEVIYGNPLPADISGDAHSTDRAHLPDIINDLCGGDETGLPEIPPHTHYLPFAVYAVYDGPAGEDPRTVSAGAVAEGLCRIIEVEGPMLAKRAYDIYLQGCGIKRMGHELRSTMNKALANAIRQGRVLSEDERGKRGLLFSVVRVKGSPPIKLRSRGPRTFEEIPPSELQTVAMYLAERRNLKSGSDEHLRAVLGCFDLKRLTAQIGTILLEILGKRYPYVDDFLRDTYE